MPARVLYEKDNGDLAVLTSFTSPQVEELLEILKRINKDKSKRNPIRTRLLKEVQLLHDIIEAGMPEEKSLMGVDTEEEM